MRRKAAIRVTVKVGAKLFKLELVPQPFNRRYWLRVNGKNSTKMPSCTVSGLMDEVRRIIVKEEKNV